MAKPVRSVARVISILTYLNEHNGSNSNQVALGTKLSRGTAYRMLQTLEAEGLVEMFQDDGRYWLTRKVNQLSHGFDDEEWISAIARPEMAALTEVIAWPVMLTTPVGIDMILRATTDRQTSLLFKRHSVGHAVPMLGSASGRCYLAYTSDSRLDTTLELISKTGPEPWAALARNRSAVREMLSSIRSKGVSIAQTPNSVSISLAVPILVRGQPRAILAMRYFKSAMEEAEALRRFLDPLLRSAERIGKYWVAELASRDAPAPDLCGPEPDLKTPQIDSDAM